MQNQDHLTMSMRCWLVFPITLLKGIVTWVGKC